jgi:menaquinone-dependent protoporphyrinogen oxidase
MRVLVTYASRHGATADIAEVVSAVLRDEPEGDAARRVDLLLLEEVEDVSGYDAVVVGSAVYLGRWMPEARAFLHENRAALRRRPVWLFSSGPIGHTAGPEQDAVDTDELIDEVQARGYAGFAGRLRRADLDLDERLAVGRLHVEEGDYRDWTRIREWAEEIADALAVHTASRAES